VIASQQVSEVIKNPLVSAVTLTGSENAGRHVAAEAGHELKKVVLELGGSDPYIVLEDADLDLAAYAITTSRYNNAGQSCIAAKRVLAVDAIRDDLQKRIIAIAKDYAYGDPMKPETKLGPLARYDLRETLHKQVVISVSQGANASCGAFMPPTVGYYYPATVLTDVPPGTPAYDEELFGPVISFIPVKDAAEAIKVANATTFGLAAGIFTNNLEEAQRLALFIESGSVTINQFTASDPRLPFGGIKHSGFGRELGAFGIREFVNVKTINVA
jgi:succinate-semialdehyde dehydrogenase/glutarate-semialdehyde dehydrogenase